MTPQADRIVALQDVIASEAEPMVILTQLLRLCRDEHPTLWEHHADPRCRARVGTLLGPVAGLLPEAGTASTLTGEARHVLAAALTANSAIPPVVVAHAAAELLDARYGHAFAEWFRRRSPYQPAVGDPIPLDSPNLRQVTDLAPTAPPWRLANRLDETRRVRLAGAWTTQFRVVFDYSLFDVLTALITRDTVVATGHPNHNLSELGLGPDQRGPAFPIEPIDLGAQADHLDQLLADAVAAGASIVVLAELCVTESLAAHLEAWVRRPGPVRLLVTGSFHCQDPADPTHRSNRALAWVRDHAAPLTHDKHSPADRPVTEDITPQGWPELRVYVTADGWHMVIAVCRDLLNPHAVHALSEAGANLVFAPSMSETLMPFGGPVAQLVGSTQAIVAVANNPADWTPPDHPDRRDLPARALFGHPGFTQQTRQVHGPDQRRGIALLDVGTGRLRWHPSEPDEVGYPAPADEIVAAPAWVRLLADHTVAALGQSHDAVTLRPAAVLAVLVDVPDGPHVLLTARALDLTHYAGQLVLPGGAVDTGDGDAVETALREAREEIGLDPASVRVIGTLPALALADSGFLVTPVIAWSAQPRYLHPANPAEVTAVRTVPLRGFRAGRREPEDVGEDALRVGAMTGAILDQLASHLAAAPAVSEGGGACA
ncbi:MAG TPA: NUDIX domain-containing protein [Acidimicrobiales bacterium]|nr:NUDIX domain-containing protein [Acidimicrobiales bacterium]